MSILYTEELLSIDSTYRPHRLFGGTPGDSPDARAGGEASTDAVPLRLLEAAQGLWLVLGLDGSTLNCAKAEK